MIRMRLAPLLFGAIIAACNSPTDGAGGVRSDEPVVTGLRIPAREVQGFFMAFSSAGAVVASPIATQPYDAVKCRVNPVAACLNASVYRQQWSDVRDWETVAAWARETNHRGRLYIVGDGANAARGIGGYGASPLRFAHDYCAFVRGVRAVDWSAEFSPGLIEPWASEAWLDDFADVLLSLHRTGNCSFRPVSEWEFNLRPRWSEGLAGAQSFVDRRSSWAASLPEPLRAPIAVSSWTLGSPGDDVPDDDPAYVERLREFKAWLFAHESVVLSRYATYETSPTDNPAPHALIDGGGNLTATGRAYAEVTARISGPGVAFPGSKCIWIAETTGGPAPYQFTWLLNGEIVSDHPAIEINSLLDSNLELIVTDALGGRSRASLQVRIASDAPPCF